MPVSLSIEYPDENDIEIDQHFIDAGTGFVKITGRDNKVRIGRPAQPGSGQFFVENGARLSIGEGCSLGGLCVYALARGASIEIGAKSSFVGVIHVTAHEPASVWIGEGCLFADETSVMASDVHRILDSRTSKRLNPPADVRIGNRVWVSGGVSVLRGAVVGDDSVIGRASIVTGRFRSNVVIAGVPARVIRKNIRWEH